MPKKGGSSSLISPMNRTGAKAPSLGGDLGVGLDFDKSPHEKVSGHNIAPGEGGTATGKRNIVTPMNPPKKVKVSE